MNKTVLLLYMCLCFIICDVKCFRKKVKHNRLPGGFENRRNKERPPRTKDPPWNRLPDKSPSRPPVRWSGQSSNPGYPVYTYHTAPQTVYIQQYRNSESRYGNLLAGLALYNLGRSHGHHYHHYYEDRHYRTRYRSATDQHPYDAPTETADCYLRLEGEGRDQKLSVPCEIVSTFTDDGEKVPVPVKTTLVCKNLTVPVEIAPFVDSNKLNFNLAAEENDEGSDEENYKKSYEENDRKNGEENDEENDYENNFELQRIAALYGLTLSEMNSPSLSWDRANERTATTSSRTEQSMSANNVTPLSRNLTSSVTNTTRDVRVCVNETSRLNETSADPLSQKGQIFEVTPTIKCTVEIETSESLLLRQVDCKALEVYSKMPEPKEENALTPSRNTLKSWIDSPPWWMAIFIAF